MIHYNSCPVCFSAEINLEINCVDYFKTNDTFPIWKCSVCGICFTQDRPDDDKLEYYYESDNYISHGNSAGGIINSIYQIVRTFTLNQKRNIVKRESERVAGSLLDIGSGTGHFAAKMKNAGWNVKGIEINKKAREFSISHFGLEVFSPSEISHLHNSEFDCITLWHSLEHFSDLNKQITEIRRLLKSQGVCIVAVPNTTSYDAKHYKKHWAAYDVPRHLWHFTPDALSLLFKNKGFKLRNIRLLPVDVFYISILSERYRKNPIAFFAGIVKGKFFALKTLFNKKGGSSLIYVFAK
jgi:2-polyprenyl-3-methyl-5-hydroxy-6-metoxy-1,4-benzoquinol methylase